MTHGQVLSLCKGRATGQELFVKRRELSADNGSALQQNHKGLCCNSPTGTSQELQTAAQSATDGLNSSESAGSYGPSGRAACTITGTW